MSLMTLPAHPVHRAVRAVFVALAIGALVGTGFAVAAVQGEKIPMPSSYGMASPRNGEIGSYNATASGAWAAGNITAGSPFEALSYIRLAGPRIADAQGRSTDTDLVA